MTTEETSESTDLAAQHKAFKENAVEVLHAYGDTARHCETFDEVLQDVGLPGRDHYYANSYYGERRRQERALKVGDTGVTGEVSAESFDAWKLATEMRLYNEAKRHGIFDAETAIVNAGFRPRSEVFNILNVVIEGTFKVPLELELPDGQNLVEAITTAKLREVRESLYDNFDQVTTWKAVVADQA